MSRTYMDRHFEALRYPTLIEKPMVDLIGGLAVLVQQYQDDYVIREGLHDLLKGARVLLDTELGRLDCGTLGSVLSHWIEECGFDPDTGADRRA